MRTRTDFADIYTNPCISTWVKDSLRSAERRDIVDAYNDADLVCELLRQRVDGALKALGCLPTPQAGE